MLKQAIVKYFFIFILLTGLLSSVVAETVDIIIITTRGERRIEKVARDIKNWGLADSDGSTYRIAGVENLDALPNLISLEIQNISGIHDYSFLLKAKGLKYLHMECIVSDLSFIEKMENLEYLSLGVNFPDEVLKTVRNTTIDLGKLDNLNFISFSSQQYNGIPNFINVKNRPFINLNNNAIERVSDEELILLKQYSLISLQYNPIVDKPLERNRLRDLNVNFDASDKRPESILKYTRGPWD